MIIGASSEDGRVTVVRPVRVDAASGRIEPGPKIELDGLAEPIGFDSAGFWMTNSSGRTTVRSWDGTELGSGPAWMTLADDAVAEGSRRRRSTSRGT